MGEVRAPHDTLSYLLFSSPLYIGKYNFRCTPTAPGLYSLVFLSIYDIFYYSIDAIIIKGQNIINN